MKTTLFIPVKNEIVGIQHIMPRIQKNWVDEIIIIDGNSDDGTYEYFLENGYKVYKQKSEGLCGAYWECFEYASGDIIIPFSPDNNSIPELLPALIAKMREGFDMVIVSRYLGGAKSEDDDFLTSIGNWLFTKSVNLLFRAHYTDTLVMYRAFTRSLVKKLNLDQKELPVLEMQMCIRSAIAGLRVAEIPGDEPKRSGGIRKMRIIYNGCANAYIVLREFFDWRKDWLMRK